MKFFAAVFLLGAFLVFIEMPEKILAQARPIQDDPPRSDLHQEYSEAGDCGATCALPEPLCEKMAKGGFVCVKGYIREYEGGPCIPPSECLHISAASTNDVYKYMLLFNIGLCISMMI